MPSFAELREKAAKAKDASVNKISNTRDKYTSTSSKDLDWDSNHKRPPPPPAPQAHTRNTSMPANNTAPPPPPTSAHSPAPPSRAPPVIRRETRPDQTPPYSPSPPPHHVPRIASHTATHSAPDAIDWAHLSLEDKEVFFSWLDEFFARHLNVTIPPRKTQPSIQQTSRPVTPLKPPPLPKWSRPPLPTTNDAQDFILSYPPPTTYGSAALDLAQYFSASTHWDSPWYMSSEQPPPLQNQYPTWTASREMRGSTKTIYAGTLFSDLSMCWYIVSFSATAHSDPNDTRAVQRSARYLPRPQPREQAILVEAHETYGETIAAFAESFEGTGQYCARGECWDLANEALKYFDQYDYVPKPVPSIGRTHGHLIFEGKAESNGAVQMGRWRGGDDRVRRGDIVEWRSVRLKMGPYAFAMLGDPDHTAVIVSDMVPSATVEDGKSVKPSELGTLEVVEQSVGRPPARQQYDLSEMQEGEVWIYRPIGMQSYVGTILKNKCPDDVNALSV